MGEGKGEWRMNNLFRKLEKTFDYTQLVRDHFIQTVNKLRYECKITFTVSYNSLTNLLSVDLQRRDERFIRCESFVRER